jgi:hypothetical protein
MSTQRITPAVAAMVLERLLEGRPFGLPPDGQEELDRVMQQLR